MRAQRIKQAIQLFCELHAIDPESLPVQEFYCAMLSEVCSSTVAGVESGIPIYLAQNRASK